MKFDKRFLITTCSYIILTAAILMCGGGISGQTRDDKLPAGRVRVKDNRPLLRTWNLSEHETYFSRTDKKINYSFHWNFKNYWEYVEELNEDVVHEWDHYKCYMFGANLQREKIEDAYVLAFLTEVLGHFNHNYLLPLYEKIYYESLSSESAQQKQDMLDSLMRTEFEEFSILESMEWCINYVFTTDIYLKDRIEDGVYFYTWDINKRFSNLDQYKHKTRDIINDMFVFYPYHQDFELDLKKYMTRQDIDKIINKILSNKITKKAIAKEKQKYSHNNTYLNKSPDKNAINLDEIIGLSNMKYLDLYEYDNIKYVYIDTDVILPLSKVRFPKNMESLYLYGAYLANVDTLDLSSCENLDYMSIYNSILPKVIKLPPQMSYMFIENNKESVIIDDSMVKDYRKYIKECENLTFTKIISENAEDENSEKDSDEYSIWRHFSSMPPSDKAIVIMLLMVMISGTTIAGICIRKLYKSLGR